MNPLPIVRASLARNPLTVILFTLLIALAVALGIAISVQERALRQGSARAADRFDLIVAAPGSQTDLLFSTVFLRPTAVELLPGQIVHQILNDKDARFVAPIAFGDSHRDSAVVGTTADFVTYLSNGLAEGQPFTSINQAVVGSLVDARVGDTLEISHGHADDLTDGSGDADSYDAGDHHDHDHTEGEAHDHHDHAHEDVTVTGRMKPTGTPWDHAVVVPVEYIWNAHVMGTGHAPGDTHIGPPWQADQMPGLPALVVKPDTIAAAYGLRSRYRTAQSTAFFPAETLVELYSVMGGATRVMSWLTLAAQVLVVTAILGGMLAVLDLQRQRFAVLRALGASAAYVFASVWIYVGTMILAGAVLGLPLGWAASAIATSVISNATGVQMTATLGWTELRMAATLLALGFALALVPAFRLYRASVVAGLR
ncbi:FtsX-like permease family protein [Paracoccus laeviglucosivorans]|uniref:Putative ABC transport system permease protein n=1 Tax=Paracoccus laeviglucosivorans TaxID=1197861 RepID=A0A521AU07_9RHOB|nr:FtsX-like permease family protein [Paracoccus laeviglucosivorans]SMO38313.1 putative ABC transport system permease protein [Paracoccus laeviglucosivorans]